MTVETWHIAYYLQTAVADYDYTLEMAPHNVMPIEGGKHQAVYPMDDNSVSVVPISNVASFDVELQWEAVTEANAGIIMSLYYDTSKANGSEHTFYWKNPFETDNIYVVRFMGPIRSVRSVEYGNYLTIDSVTIRVEGVKA
jgi:hypothetical protein